MRNYFLIFCSLLLLLNCSCGYRADRFDEHLITEQSNHFNLYRNVPLEILGTPGSPEKVSDQALVRKMTEGEKLALGENKDSFSVLPSLFKRTPPLVHIYQKLRGKKEKKLLFSIPLVQWNSREVRQEKNGDRFFQILLSLRSDTLFPILMKNNYELYLLTVRYAAQDQTWTIEEIKALTDSKYDSIQGVWNSTGTRMAYVEDNRKGTSRLWIGKLDDPSRKLVAEKAMLPCFLPDGKLLFVKDSGIFRDFRVYNPDDGTSRPAADPEIAEVLRMIPHSLLKEFYLHFKKNDLPTEKYPASETLRSLYEYGLRNSPLILQSYYNLLAVQARRTQNLFDLGPDFFLGADYLVTSNILFDTPDDPYYVIGDRIGNDNFIRFLTGFSIPVLPNLPLRWARRYYDDWKVLYCQAEILKAVNEFSGRLSRFAFQYWQNRDNLETIRHQLARNMRQLERFQHQLQEGYGTSERVLFAKNLQEALKSRQEEILLRLVQTQTELACLIGRNPEKPIHLLPAGDIPEKLESLYALHEIDWFLAQSRINRQEIRLLEALIQQEAATRDMGPEQTRIDAVRLQISYGVGFIDWQRLVDDFLLLGVSHVMPMRLPVFFSSYYEDYESRIMALRMRKYELEGATQGEIVSLWSDFAQENSRRRHRFFRAETLREQARIASLLQTYGNREMMSPNGDENEYTAEVASLAEQTSGRESDYERLRRLSQLYQAAGRSDFFLQNCIASLETQNLPGQALNVVENRGIYLWKALETLCSKDRRNAFLARCEQEKISLVYCYFSMGKDQKPFLQKYEPEYAYFIEECRRRKIRVFALMGEQEWLDPAQRKDLRILLNSFLEFNRQRAARGSYGFDGLSLDVEPHSVSGWRSGERNKLIRNYLDLLKEVRKTLADQSLLDAAIPCNYAGIPVPGSSNDFLKEISKEVNSLTLMAYQDTWRRVVDRALPVLKRQDLSCGLRVAVETQEVEEEGVSFFGLNRNEFRSALQECAKRFSNHKNFCGMVIHDDAGFQQMR